MNQVPVFISYDFDHDADLVQGLREQASRTESPFWIKDLSLSGPIDGKWETEVERRISQCQMVFVVCGKNVHSAPGVTKEVQMAKRLGKPIHLLDAGARGRSRPVGVPETQPFLPMDWKTLSRVIHPNG